MRLGGAITGESFHSEIMAVCSHSSSGPDIRFASGNVSAAAVTITMIET